MAMHRPIGVIFQECSGVEYAAAIDFWNIGDST